MTASTYYSVAVRSSTFETKRHLKLGVFRIKNTKSEFEGSFEW